MSSSIEPADVQRSTLLPPDNKRALATGDPTLVTAAALELGRLSLADALAVCLVFRDHDHDRYERAAVRWLSRFCHTDGPEHRRTRGVDLL